MVWKAEARVELEAAQVLGSVVSKEWRAWMHHSLMVPDGTAVVVEDMVTAMRREVKGGKEGKGRRGEEKNI